jgi:diketogulonate reductase-like aldo/keto reductase
MHKVFANGAEIPAIGFGTYGMARPETPRTIPIALKGGFRHIDTAQVYRNEAEVGECIASSGIPRSEIFVTTKLWVANYPQSRFVSSVDESLRKLRTDYIDLATIALASRGADYPATGSSVAHSRIGRRTLST